MGLAVSFFRGYVRIWPCQFFPKVVPQSRMFWQNLEILAAPIFLMASEGLDNVLSLGLANEDV